jgi:hypothetical protein
MAAQSSRSATGKGMYVGIIMLGSWWEVVSSWTEMLMSERIERTGSSTGCGSRSGWSRGSNILLETPRRLFCVNFSARLPHFCVLTQPSTFVVTMPSILKASKPSSTSRSSSKSAKTSTKKPPLPESSSEADEDEEESDDEGVDGEGMERLMKALGKDGLDEYEQAQLQMLGGEDEEEWETDEEEKDGEAGESGEEDSDEEAEGLDDENVIEGPSGEEEEQDDIALDDVDDSVDEDAVPRQKIEIDNKVCS